MPPNAVGRRAAAPHRIVDPVAGDLIGVKLHILIQKTLGGIQTDLVLARPGLIADAMFKQRFQRLVCWAGVMRGRFRGRCSA